MRLRVFAERMAVCRLASGEPVPGWAMQTQGFCSVTRTAEELSVVCAEAVVPPEARQEKGWKLLCVEGTLDFAMTGVLESLARPLSEAGISLFAISTYNTDYLLVRENTLEPAVAALRAAGHTITE